MNSTTCFFFLLNTLSSSEASFDKISFFTKNKYSFIKNDLGTNTKQKMITLQADLYILCKQNPVSTVKHGEQQGEKYPGEPVDVDGSVPPYLRGCR